MIALGAVQAHHVHVATMRCCWCQSEGDGDHPDWAFSRRGDQITFTCPQCLRTHLREIETSTD